MDIFTKNKLFVRIIVLLIFLNLLSTAYLLWDKQGRPGPGEPRAKKEKGNSTQLLKEKLHLTREQEETLFKLREEYAGEERKISELIRAQRDSMNAAMFRAETDSLFLKNLAKRVAENEYRMELLRIDQAQKLMGICTSEQLKEFQHLMMPIRDFLQPSKKKE